jgi:mono/diheme cytochrome c family protein
MMPARICSIGLVVVLAGGLSVAAQQPKPAAATPPASIARSQWSGIYSDAQARRGEPLYAENCAYCHGADLQGTISAPPLTASALSARWLDKTLADLYEYQQVFMPWNSPGGFGRLQNVDILAYVLKKGGFPAGTDLPAQADAQRQIRILSRP